MSDVWKWMEIVNLHMKNKNTLHAAIQGVTTEQQANNELERSAETFPIAEILP